MKDSLVNQLVSWLHKQQGWVAKGEITAIQWKDRKGKTFLPETVGRKLREAEESSRIAVKDTGVSVSYKWLPYDRRESYIQKSRRADQTILFR